MRRRTQASQLAAVLANPTADAWLEAVHRGLISWDRAFYETREDWKRLARYIFRRWKLPAGVEVHDVEQELLSAAFEESHKWRPGGAAFGVFVRWNAVTRAKKWVHKQRNAKRRDDKAPSRFPQLFGETAPEQPIDASQDLEIEALQKIGWVLEICEISEPRCFVALIEAGGNLGQAAETVYKDPALRRSLGAKTKDDARRALGCVVHQLQIEA